MPRRLRTDGLKLSFHGGVGTVTGSRFLLETGRIRTLIDAGLFQGLKEHRLLNWKPPAFDPHEIDQILLTHAHIDHSGYLPRLARGGFRGPIHCTAATEELAELLLLDAAHLQEEDAAYANKRGYSKHKPALPLFTTRDAQSALERLRPARYGQWLELGKGLRARFHNSGHILGAAIVEVRVDRKRDRLTIVFSGDLGRYDVPLHTDPDPLPECDVLVVESTYGDRDHEERPVEEQIREPFRRALERGGVILIPAFAVGRSQLVTLVLRRMMTGGELPEVPIHIDSPMAVAATRIYSQHLSDRNLDAQLAQDGRTRLFPDNVYFHSSTEESKSLNELSGPRVIVSASGMMTGGRILHHLVRKLPDPKNLIALVGFQATGTRGRALQNGARTLRMHGQDVPVRAEVVDLHGLSAHADRREILRWIETAQRRPETVYVVHGEPSAAGSLAKEIRERFGSTTYTPQLGDAHDLEPSE